MGDRRDFFEHLIFRSMGSRRYTQDSPVLPDVWLAYGLHPGQPQDLLLTPHAESSPFDLARRLRKRLGQEARVRAKIAHNQTTVAARLSFYDMVQVVLPMSSWWRDYLILGDGNEPVSLFREDPEGFAAILIDALEAERFEAWQASVEDDRALAITEHLVWLARILGVVALVDREWAGVLQGLDEEQRESEHYQVRALTTLVEDEEKVIAALIELIKDCQSPDLEVPPALWTINRNRATEASLYRSGNAVKADAVHTLFKVRGKGIRWAVVDSGIDARHLAFRKRKEGRPLGSDGKPFVPDPRDSEPADTEAAIGGGAFYKVKELNRWINQTRIRATYDFTRVRDLLSGDPKSLAGVPEEMRQRASDLGLEDDLRKALKFGSMIDWELLEKLLRVPHTEVYRPPEHFHGTHVAGIIGADWRTGEHGLSPETDRTGVAPEIELFDLRALDENGEGDEFSIMAAMQFVRHLNLRKTGHNQMEIHGVNLSFAIRHEVSNFACGRTPVCDEAERLVGNGVVVVAAAGNLGRARYRTSTGKDDEGYRSISITDPGNAEGAITVGATHHSEPHTYGVSYFSSRGPTGDGRRKPDLVAPGEKIYSTAPKNSEKHADGTSQAAPHVSGGAALLMARNIELVGRPTRIKEILCRSATDLGREPYFQGAGMLDILRALQSV